MRNIVDSGGSQSAFGMPDMLPVSNATVPYWRTQLHAIDEHRSTESLPLECDIAIIGAGMAGVSTAYHLTAGERKPSIVILEARQVCSGATGRNGGHIKYKVNSIHKLIERHGLELATEIRDLSIAQIYALKNIVQKEGLDCEFELRRSYDVFLDETEAENVRKKFDASLKAGEPWTRDVDYVGPEHAEQVTAVKGAKAAFSMPACSLWPYRMVSQVLARLVERDAVNLQTNTPVTRVETDNASGLSFIETPRGSLKAKKVVFATNAYTAGICSSYRNRIIPFLGTASHISPSSPVSPHLSHTYNISYEPGFSRVDYLNPRPDGGIVVGGGKWTYSEDRSKWYNTCDDSYAIEEARPHFEGLMQRHFNGWANSEAKVDHLWTGVQGYTPDELPHIGEVPGKNGQQYVIAGFNGGGMPVIFLSAKGLAHMIEDGASYESTGLPRLFKSTRDRLQGPGGIKAPEART